MCDTSIPKGFNGFRKKFQKHIPLFYHQSPAENQCPPAAELSEKDMTTNEKYKILHRKLKEFNKENHFRFKTKKMILREQNGILHYAFFTLQKYNAVCELGVKPLYIPSEVANFDLRLSIDLKDLGKCSRFPWGSYGNDEINFTKDIDEILSILEHGGLRWFVQFDSPEACIKTSLNKNFVRKFTINYTASACLRTVALSYLYLGDFENGKRYLLMLLAENEQYAADWYTAHKEQNPYTLQRIEQCKRSLEICETTPERWQSIFENIIIENRIALKLDK